MPRPSSSSWDTVCCFCSGVRYFVSLWQRLLCPRPQERGNKRCFRPSVRPSIAYIANNLRTQRPNLPKFGRKVEHLRCNSHTNFEVKRSKVSVTRSINADRHREPYHPNAKACELQTWYTDGGRRSASATGVMTSKVKGQGCYVTWSVWAFWPNAVPVSLEAGGGIPCWPNPAATLLVNFFIFTTLHENDKSCRHRTFTTDGIGWWHWNQVHWGQVVAPCNGARIAVDGTCWIMLTMMDIAYMQNVDITSQEQRTVSWRMKPLQTSNSAILIQVQMLFITYRYMLIALVR